MAAKYIVFLRSDWEDLVDAMDDDDTLWDYEDRPELPKEQDVKLASDVYCWFMSEGCEPCENIPEEEEQ